MHKPLLEILNLKTYFDTYRTIVKAVDGVSFHIADKEVLGLVGESGCGKSVSALSILKLIPEPPGRIVGGRILFQGTDLLKIPHQELKKIRGNRISMIFQEPMTSLSPVFTVGEQIAEVFRLHLKLNRKEAIERSIDILKHTKLPDAENVIKRYPHELSGGMRQRAMIAMALACNPSVLIADEPTTALDVTIQAQILDLMMHLMEEFGMSILLITHDLGVVAHTTTRVVVMYVGKIIEEAATADLFHNPLHPYTQGLIKSVPTLEAQSSKEKTRLNEIPGVVPSLHDLPPGCKFAPRCAHVMDLCRRSEPKLEEIERSHYSSCWLTSREL
jgi:peptide/nickel transport system ATP-binding protein/oligopeptide transport system ATP-binding protein